MISPAPEHSSEDSEDEIAERRFKYKRVLNDFSEIWENDAASCVQVHPKFIVLGTDWGKSSDHVGTILRNILDAHSTAVKQLSIDEGGEYVASCATDGKICICGLWTGEQQQSASRAQLHPSVQEVDIAQATEAAKKMQRLQVTKQIFNMDRPIRSIALEPAFAKHSSRRQFVSGDRDLVLHEKIVFCNDSGVRVFDREAETMVMHLLRRHDLSLRSDLYPAHVAWLSDVIFAVGWADTLTVCHVKSAAPVSFAEAQTRYAEIDHMFTLHDFFISGLSWDADGQNVVVLAVCRSGGGADENEETKEGRVEQAAVEFPHMPRVLLLEPLSLQDYNELTEDLIGLSTAKDATLLCRQLHMASLPQESAYFVVAPREFVVARPCNSDDHVAWLLENGWFKKALEFVSTPHPERKLVIHSRSSVARHYVDHLLTAGQYEQAAELLVVACGARKDTWEEFVTRFDGIGQLKFLANHIPTKNPQLEPECYELMLSEFLKNDIPGYAKLIKSWSPDLFRVGAVIKDALDRLYRQSVAFQSGDETFSSEDRESLLETLALLYTYQRDMPRALALYLKLGNEQVFELIERYRLFAMVKDKIHELMSINKDLTIKLLLNNKESVPVETVVSQLSSQPIHQLDYLDRLFSRGDGTQELANLAVNLYAQHDRSRMLKFLKSATGLYNVEKALTVTKQYRMLQEMVFLLAKGGNCMEALKVIIGEAQDIDMAIEFCKEHDDEDLWRELIRAAVTNAGMTRTLLQTIGTHVDPMMVIQAIDPRMRIEGLRDCLVKILTDYSMQINLQEGCRRIMVTDCHSQLAHLASLHRRGVTVKHESSTCTTCGLTLVTFDPRRSSALKLFKCGHGVHRTESCDRDMCKVCKGDEMV